METHLRLLFVLTTLLLLLHPPTFAHSLGDSTTFSTQAAAHTTVSAPAPATTTTYPTNNDTQFIRSSCASTLYPDECYNSLVCYASAIEQNPARLASVAIAVSLSRVRVQAAYFSNLSKEADYGVEHRLSAALHDCFSTFCDAVDQMRNSLDQMRNLVPSASSETFKFQMSNVQTWMSAALTNEDTCIDGFDGVSDGPVKKDVFHRVHKVETVTSNALALVNSFAKTVSADASFP